MGWVLVVRGWGVWVVGVWEWEDGVVSGCGSGRLGACGVAGEM